MKNMHKNRSGGESCSCTTCVYKSESDHPSLRRIIDLGSRIDRLYYGKYIPLRERKLLERLVRTRAVYDDIRAKLVSDSTLSLSTKGDYNPRKKVSVRELDDTERSSGAVLELVNMVDRGAIGSKKLEDCCSCCSCSSKIKIHEHRHRQRRTYAGAEEYLARQRRLRESYHRKKGVRFKTKHIRSDPCTCTFKLIKKHSKAIYKKMHARPHIPLFDLHPDEEIKQNHIGIGEVARTSFQNLIHSTTPMRGRISGGIAKLRESQIQIQEKIELQAKMSIEKFNRAKGKLISKVRTGAQVSEFGPENELAFQVKKDSISKFKEELRRKKIMKDWECEPECIEEICVPEDCFVRLEQKKIKRRNIHHKGMNYNIRTQERKSGEPLHQSYYKIQAPKFEKAKIIETNNPALRAQQTRGIKESRLSLEKAQIKLQKLGVTNVADKKGNETSDLKVIPVKAKPEEISDENVKASHPTKNTKLENSSLERKSSQRQVVRIGSSFSFNVEFYKDKPGPNLPGLSSQSFTNSKQTSGIDPRNKKHIKEKKTKKRQLRQHGSQIELRKSLKDTKTGGHALKRCFCTLKLKAKSKQSTISRSVTKKMMTTEQSGLIFNNVQTNTAGKLKKDNISTKLNLLPYECEPGVCVPGQCDPYQCIKLINIRKAKRRNSSTQARKTRSTSSFTSRSYKPSKAKNVQSKVTYRGKASKQQRFRRGNVISNSHRRAVRIGSTFSFNVEFYKDRPKYKQATRSPSELKSLSIKPKNKEHRKVKLKNRGYQGNVGNLRRNSPTQMVKRERNARIGTTLRRCFCTLSLQRKVILKDHDTKSLTIGTETSELKPVDTANKSTKTKLKYSRTLKPYECEPYTCVPGACDPYMCLERINVRKPRQKEIGLNSYRHKTPLEPYECEPFTCIPGECDPYVCLEVLNKRNKRLKEVGMTTNHSNTTSSASGNAYEGKSLRTVQVQYKPRYKERKVSAKTRKAKQYDQISNKKKYDVSKYPSSAKSRQAVKISSTFSFDIEFYKNKSPNQEIKQIYPAEKITRANTSKRSINKGIKVKKFNVAQVESQFQGPMKRDKSSVVGPLLKRCFCTLNLQKKWKHQYFKKETSASRFLQPPRVYAVNRAMIGYTKGIARYKNQLTKTSVALQHKDNIDVYKINNILKPINVNAEKKNFEMSQQCKSAYRIHSQQRVASEQLEKFVEDTVHTGGFPRNCSMSSQIHETRLTSLTRYFRRCFYTMNLEIQNRGKYKNKERHKLLPYECEPGICIPGECDPSECQKMIAKRLMKSSSKKSGTGYSSHSISSTANQPFSKSKEYKQQALQRKANRSQVFTEKARVYTKTAKNNKKKAVRLGSTFSFNIELYKSLSNAHKNAIVPKYSSDTNLAKHSKSKSTGERKRNSVSQSQFASIKTVNRGAFTNSSMKRCFCTLKLQKKGRLHKEIESQQQLIPLNELNREKMISRGQNTKAVKPLKLTHVLEPYECEPNVCIPGQCDPYQCLERIKKRSYQEEGFNTILPDTKSISSMITDYPRKKNHKSRSIGVKPKDVTITKKNGKSYPEPDEPSHPKPSREAVRIGSSFNFNIEFFKDRPSHPYPTNTYVKENKYLRDPSTYTKKHLDNFTQNKKKLRHKQSQFENIARHASTLTNSFIKRCFCTAQLNKSKNTNITLKSERNENSPSFVKRCFCVLKKLNPRIANTVTDVKPKETKDIMINTRKMNDKPKLELYECKPGICVPGECNPYICDKIMRRYRNNNSKATLVDSIKKRSISSYSNNINNGKKSVQTVMKRKDYHNRRIKGKNIETTSISKPNATSWRPGKNVVRIGSKFSFDIEFFKDHSSKINHINQRSVTHKEKSVKDTDNKKKVKIGSTKTISPSYISQSSQVKKKAVKNRCIGINNLIKRCFCTLKLNEKNNYKHKIKTKEIDDHISKKVSTKSVMTVEKNKLLRNPLLPYECEPNTCIPYQCDPYECEKRIKIRHKNQVNREFGVSTLSPGQVSAYSLTDPKKPKTRSQSIMTKKIHQRVKHTPYIIDSDTDKVGQSKQSVRIGSTFSFNIEFFKDKHNDGFDLRKLPKIDHDRKERPNIQGRGQGKHSNQINHGSKKKNTGQTQFDKNLMISNNTQFLNPVMRTQSTITNYAPKKRCFCTLSLKKSTHPKVKPPVSVKTLHASTETDVLKTPMSNILPYECEPDVCVPYECNPVQCLDRIKRRHGMLLPFECEPNVCVPGECNPVQCSERIKKRHKARGTTMIESQINTLGTSMEESQTRNAATIMKKEKGAKNKTAQQKQLRHTNRKNIHEQKTDSCNNRQAVRIGSNFSFDIEFFKTNTTELAKPHNELPQPRKTKHQLKNKAAYGNFEGKKPSSRALQSFSPKKVSHGSSIGSVLKRCFCTLKLQKSQVSKMPTKSNPTLTEIKPKQRNISSNNKSTATRKLPMEKYRLSPFECEPFYCVPGECNPYECAKRIEMREKKHKTQYTITQSHTQSHKGVGVKQHYKNSRRSQASFTDKNSAGPNRSEIVEIPRFPNIFNKQGVRIGSNISFNIEFYKENLPIKSDNPKRINYDYDKKVKHTIIKRKVNKNIHHREQNTNMTRLRSSGSEYDKTKSENKSVEVENILKRCFCTLRLQNRSPSEIKKQNMQTEMHLPQHFEVRRVAVQHNPKLLSKEKQIEVKSVATKVNKKDLNRKTDLTAPCNFLSCKDGITLLPEDMKTILPYMPEKFNKTVSRTVLPLESKHKKLRESMLTNRGKRLTRKRSVKHFHKKQPQIQVKHASDKSFLGIKCFIDRCAKMFYPKKNNSQKNQLTENIRKKTMINATKSPKSEQQPTPNQLISNLKQRKCVRTCPYYLVYQSGDTEQWPPGISVKLKKKRISKSKSLSKKSNTKQQITSKKKTKDRHCTCSMNLIRGKKLNKSLIMNEEEIMKKDKDLSSPLRVRFDDTTMTKNKPQSDKANIKCLPNSKKKLFASGTKSDRGIKSSNYCRPCRGKIVKEEFHKAAGDQFLYKTISNIKSPCCSVEKIKTKIKDKMRCAMNAEKPLFEMHVDSHSNEILNRNEVIHNIGKLKTKCKPMIEVQVDPKMRRILNKRAVIDDVIASNAKMNENSVLRSIMEIGLGQGKFCPCRRGLMKSRYTENRKPSGKPCICGSSVCAKKVESMKTPITRHKWKTCVCGSPVCDSESAKIKALSAYVENKCLCQKEMEKRKAKKLEKENKERATRLKQYKKSDKIRRNERKKEHKILERKIDKKATDGILFAESVLDVGKFGITATTDLLRQVARCARDPKQAIRTLRTLEENPKLLAKFIRSSYDDTGLKATLRRVRLRCLAMRGMIKLRRKLQSYPLTNYLMNISSNDPRRRLLKKKKELPKRERERLDFNCSLYMASLRKRPYLSVYDRCPWFYSHFLSLVYAWKQFIDICLFLLAAVVWSPCILCMEICRACMCCFFCTG